MITEIVVYDGFPAGYSSCSIDFGDYFNIRLLNPKFSFAQSTATASNSVFPQNVLVYARPIVMGRRFHNCPALTRSLDEAE